MSAMKLDIILEEEETVEVGKEFLATQKTIIKQLTQMLKLRLRTQVPNSNEIYNSLNERILNFSEYQEKIEEIYQKVNTKSKIYRESIQKAKKYDELLKRINDIENNYKDKISEQIQTIGVLEQKIQRLQQENQKLADISPNQTSPKQQQPDPQIQQLKSQVKNLTSLLKQQTEEKEFSQKQQTEIFEQKILSIRNELQKVQLQYQEKREIAEEKIVQLERENQLLKKEIELNQEFTFLQSQSNNTNQLDLGASSNSLMFSQSNLESPGKVLRSSLKSRSRSGKKIKN